MNIVFRNILRGVHCPGCVMFDYSQWFCVLFVFSESRGGHYC